MSPHRRTRTPTYAHRATQTSLVFLRKVLFFFAFRIARLSRFPRRQETQEEEEAGARTSKGMNSGRLLSDEQWRWTEAIDSSGDLNSDWIDFSDGPFSYAHGGDQFEEELKKLRFRCFLRSSAARLGSVLKRRAWIACARRGPMG